MTNDEVRALTLGDTVRYGDRDYVVESVSPDDPTPSVRLIGVPFAVYGRDLKALPPRAPIIPVEADVMNSAPDSEPEIESPSA